MICQLNLRRALLLFTALMASQQTVCQTLTNSLSSDLACSGPWYAFGQLCWTPVPMSLTLLDDKYADSYCSERGARILRLMQYSFCVREAIGLQDNSLIHNLIEGRRAGDDTGTRELTSEVDAKNPMSILDLFSGPEGNVKRKRKDTIGQVYKACVISTLFYGCECWTLNTCQERRLNLFQFHKRFLRRILDITCKDKVPDNTARERSGLSDIYTLL